MNKKDSPRFGERGHDNNHSLQLSIGIYPLNTFSICDQCKLEKCDTVGMEACEIHRHNVAVKNGIVPRFCEDES